MYDIIYGSMLLILSHPAGTLEMPKVRIRDWNCSARAPKRNCSTTYLLINCLPLGTVRADCKIQSHIIKRMYDMTNSPLCTGVAYHISKCRLKRRSIKHYLLPQSAELFDPSDDVVCPSLHFVQKVCPFCS